jgi:hypothetical protein
MSTAIALLLKIVDYTMVQRPAVGGADLRRLLSNPIPSRLQDFPAIALTPRHRIERTDDGALPQPPFADGSLDTNRNETVSPSSW